MAVYTAVSDQVLASWLRSLGLGELQSARGVSAGIENSTYFLQLQNADATSSEYVLTIVEQQSARETRFVAELMTLLAKAALPVPCPVADAQGRHALQIAGKPALLVPRAAGSHPLLPSPPQCRQIGAFLGRMHKVTCAAGLFHISHRDLGWLCHCADQVAETLNCSQQAVLRDESLRVRHLRQSGLPQAVIHGDLFRDNALFSGNRLDAVIDFFMAGTGPLLLDLAILVNDWCSTDTGELDKVREAQILAGYRESRPLEREEERRWQDTLCVAATRFWVSRLAPSLASPGINKDPEILYRILLARRRLR